MNVIIETNAFLVSFHFASDDIEELKKLPDLAREAEKDSLIAQLTNSSSFARTHAVVAGLLEHSDFTPDQANGIVDAALMNDQVRWISTDEDLEELLTRVVSANQHQLDPKTLRKIRGLLSDASEEKPAFEDDPPT